MKFTAPPSLVCEIGYARDLIVEICGLTLRDFPRVLNLRVLGSTFDRYPVVSGRKIELSPSGARELTVPCWVSARKDEGVSLASLKEEGGWRRSDWFQGLGDWTRAI
jgi:hypothetical protein